jgi:membrane protease YdiL (CAAX protease family)
MSHSQANSWLTNSVIGQFIFILLAEGLVLGALYLFLKHYKTTWTDIGLRRPRLKDFGWGILAVPVYMIFYLVIVSVVGIFFKGLDVNQQQEIGFNNVAGALPLVLTFISLVILPAFTEEVLVRGFLYGSLKKALPIIWAALLTSALFALAHLPEGGDAGPLYIAGIDTFVLSMVLIYLREKTGSLWASITLHALKNSIAFTALFVLHLS